MEDVTLAHAKEHLEELIEKAARGEIVRIVDPKVGQVELTLVRKDRVIATPRKPRRLGALEGKIPPPPDDFFDPLTEEELKDWYGDDT